MALNMVLVCEGEIMRVKLESVIPPWLSVCSCFDGFGP